MERIVLSGRIERREWGEGEALFIGTGNDPFAEVLGEHKGCRASVRYWIDANPVTEERAVEIVARICTGEVDAEFEAIYSETTGFLWLNEDCHVGGHDLLGELEDMEGYSARVEIDIHGQETPG